MGASGQATTPVLDSVNGAGPADAVRERLDDPRVAEALTTLLDHADLLAVLVSGLDGFVRTWPIHRGAPILLCSSVIGVWGGKGTAGYAAANRLLDVTAARLRADGHHCVSVRWGLWQGAGVIDAAETARVCAPLSRRE